MEESPFLRAASSRMSLCCHLQPTPTSEWPFKKFGSQVHNRRPYIHRFRSAANKFAPKKRCMQSVQFVCMAITICLMLCITVFDGLTSYLIHKIHTPDANTTNTLSAAV